MTDQITGFETSFVGLFEGLTAAVADDAMASIRNVEIPLIQRDYAQGRRTEKVEDIRLAFLEAIRGAIVDGQHLSLDFVYGGVADGVLRPLDGQQRLTTLFLLHWYLARRSGHFDPQAVWGQFTYDTRPSARRFCGLLMAASPPAEEADWGGLAEWLTDQAWYLPHWDQDPSISSMLVMLGDIHEMFKDVDFPTAWNRLTDPQRPAISFYVLPIKEIGAGDELYIKMNSRGKPLTDFETFKARFVQAIEPPERASAVAYKLDGAWSDILWPFHGGDNIVDDEFLHYIEFLVDVGEWRTRVSSQGNLLARATRLLGGSAEDAQTSLDFFERAFDTWEGVDVAAVFEGFFRSPGQAPTGPDDLRPALFTPEWLNGVNLFDMCCRTYGDMRGDRQRVFPLGLTILLYAVLVHRIEQTEDAVRRLRTLRNLVEASENEVRVERMPDHLAEVEHLMRTGVVAEVKSFNQIQVSDEVRKAGFLREAPESAAALAALEDHRLLRGTLMAFHLEATTIGGRATAFEEVFADDTHWLSLTGALLACGDYRRRRNAYSFQFGSPTTDSWWRALLTGPARTPLEDVRAPLSHLLDQVTQRSGPLPDVFAQIVDRWLEDREETSQFDWRYHFVKYPEMREGTSGIFVSASGDLGYDVCALKRSTLNSNYRDPYLLAIYRLLEMDRHRLQDPWFTGPKETPRWLQIRRTDIAVRSVETGLEIAVPPEIVDEVLPLVQSVVDVEARNDGFLWPAPKLNVEGEAVDTVDRVSVGAALMRSILGGLDPAHLHADLQEEIAVRAEILSAVIVERIGRRANVTKRWVYVPKEAAAAWVALELDGRPCIELVLKPGQVELVDLQVKAYPSYGKSASCLPGFDHIPLGVDWSASDEQIADAFLGHVDSLQ